MRIPALFGPHHAALGVHHIELNEPLVFLIGRNKRSLLAPFVHKLFAPDHAQSKYALRPIGRILDIKVLGINNLDGPVAVAQSSPRLDAANASRLELCRQVNKLHIDFVIQRSRPDELGPQIRPAPGCLIQLPLQHLLPVVCSDLRFFGVLGGQLPHGDRVDVEALIQIC